MSKGTAGAMRTTTTDSSALAAQEQWLRSNGLPLVVPPLRRLRGIVPRTVPILVTLALLAIALLIADAAVSSDAVLDLFELYEHPVVLATLGIAALLALLAIPTGIAYGRLQKRLTPRTQLIVGIVIILFWLGALSGIAALAGAQMGLHIGVETRIVLLVVAGLAGYYGWSSMAGWALRRGFRELSATIPSIARILPLLLLTVLLVFFTNELWQLAATMTKTRMWLLGGFLVLLILLIVLPAAFDMIDDDVDDDCDPLLTDTPFVGLSAARSRLSLGERFNLVVVSLAVQFVQVFLFVFVTFAVFAIIGSISLTDKLISTWTGAPPSPLVVVSVGLPMDAAMFRVCLILALFSGITFAASTIQDAKYRDMFLNRVSDEVQRNLAARHRYRATLLEHGKAPARWQALIHDDE